MKQLSNGVKMLLSLVYMLLVTIVGGFALQYINQPDASSHQFDKSIREMVARPTETGLLDRIGGLSDVKDEMRRLVQLPLKYPNVFYRGAVGFKPPTGVLFHGPPGTGKTMMATALAAECGVPLLSLHSAALESKWFGESPKLIESAFRLAREELAPCIIFFDEIDGIGRARNEMDQSCVYSLKCELLRNLDGIVGHPVIVLACTNCPQSLDPALRRRFSQSVAVNLPDRAARLEILTKVTRDEPTVDRRLLERVADRTSGLSGSDLATLYANACAARFRSVDVDRMLSEGRVASGVHMMHALGPLTASHWTSTKRFDVEDDEEGPPPSAIDSTCASGHVRCTK